MGLKFCKLGSMRLGTQALPRAQWWESDEAGLAVSKTYDVNLTSAGRHHFEGIQSFLWRQDFQATYHQDLPNNTQLVFEGGKNHLAKKRPRRELRSRFVEFGNPTTKKHKQTHLPTIFPRRCRCQRVLLRPCTGNEERKVICKSFLQKRMLVYLIPTLGIRTC